MIDGLGDAIRVEATGAVSRPRIGRKVGIDRPGTEGVEGKFGLGE
jgi:hypothetical protein